LGGVVFSLLLAGCFASHSPPPAVGAEQAIAELMDTHRQAVLTDDVQGLLDIWADDGIIIDANHTPDDPTDDHVWRGLDAVLSYYATVLFPLYLTEIGPVDTVLTVNGLEAVMTGTTMIGTEVSPGGERWTFAFRDGEWKIIGLTFNLESNH
jgi:hypothetical protein